MTIINDNAQILYASVPKVACTSIKYFFHEAMTKQPFPTWEELKDKSRRIHVFYPGVKFSDLPEAVENMHRVSLVRHPTDRMVSAYNNIVWKYRQFEKPALKAKLEAQRLDTLPGFEQFIQNLQQYQSASSFLWHHTLPLTDWLGSDARYWDKVYGFNELPQFFEDMNARMETKIVPQHRQKSYPHMRHDKVQPSTETRIAEIFASDLEIYGPFMA